MSKLRAIVWGLLLSLLVAAYFFANGVESGPMPPLMFKLRLLVLEEGFFSEQKFELPQRPGEFAYVLTEKESSSMFDGRTYSTPQILSADSSNGDQLENQKGKEPRFTATLRRNRDLDEGHGISVSIPRRTEAGLSETVDLQMPPGSSSVVLKIDDAESAGQCNYIWLRNITK